jgi:hypothetical protein
MGYGIILVWVAVGQMDIGLEGFELAPNQESFMRNDQGKNHIFV